MITVAQAEQLILAQARDYGTEHVDFDAANGRILAQDILADRDLPPFNRVTMDGIAIKYQAFINGCRSFHIVATQAAGQAPIQIHNDAHCVEIMTGAALPPDLDTIIRYEDVEILGQTANVMVNEIVQGQHIHFKGKDKQAGDVLVAQGCVVTPAIVGIGASAGKAQLQVKKLPRVVIITSGDELVEVTETPQPFQIRRSNNYSLKAVLQRHVLAADMLHIPDEPEHTKATINRCLEKYDVILLSGGVSMGKFDHIPDALQQLSVAKIFHRVQQRPGKPFWFGASKDGVLVFAFPGNPVAAFMCVHRYFLPWLQASLQQEKPRAVYGVLSEDFSFEPDLQYFLQVQTAFAADGRLMAWPLAGNGSGDFANLAHADAFLELPAEKTFFNAGDVFPLWPFK